MIINNLQPFGTDVRRHLSEENKKQDFFWVLFPGINGEVPADVKDDPRYKDRLKSGLLVELSSAEITDKSIFMLNAKQKRERKHEDIINFFEDLGKAKKTDKIKRLMKDLYNEPTLQELADSDNIWIKEAAKQQLSLNADALLEHQKQSFRGAIPIEDVEEGKKKAA